MNRKGGLGRHGIWQRKRTTMGKQNKALKAEVGLDGARVLIGLGTWKTKVKTAVAERDRPKSQEVM